MSEAVSLNRILYAYDSEEEAFPKVDPLIEPAGSLILVQVRTPKRQTKSGIFIPEDVRDTEFWTTQVAKVVAIGPLAFHNRNTGEVWPEGAWCSPGDYIRIPRYGGDRWTVPLEGSSDEALMVLYKDTEILGRIKGGWKGALKIKAFI